MENLIVRTLTNRILFEFYFDEIHEFCREAVKESDAKQTEINMGWENWDTNNECLLYRIYMTNNMIDGNGACVFIFIDDKIIGCGGVEIWNKNVSSLSKRTFVLKKYRQRFFSSTYLTPACIKWTEENHPDVKLYMLTYNEYTKNTMLSTMKKFLYREIDWEGNYWPEWSLYPGTISIYNLEQYVIYKLKDETIENTPNNIKSLIQGEDMSIYNIEDSNFTSIYVDLTLRCNMNCNICYNSKNMKDSNFDMDVDYFREVVRRLSLKQKNLYFDFLGGEPTMHPKLHEFIEIVNEYGHSCCIQTNGLNFADTKFIEELKTWKDPKIAKVNPMYMGGDYPFSVCFDLSGGTKHNKFYKKLNNMNCLEHKLNSLQYALEMGMTSIAITAIVIRDYNEEVIPELLELSDKHPEIVVVNFRNFAKSGKWAGIENEPYSIKELKELIRPYYPNMESLKKPGRWIPTGDQKCYGCCHRFIANKTRISLIDFASETSAKCWKRGYLSNDSFEITNFFERIIKEG